MRHLAHHLKGQDTRTAKEFSNKADEAQRRSELVRQAVISHEELNMELVEEEST